MATTSFEHHYAAVNGPATPIDGEGFYNVWPGTIDVTYTEPLNVGDPISVLFPNGSVQNTWVYAGVTASGEMVASSLNNPTAAILITDETYTLGSPFPAYTATTFCFLFGTLIATPKGDRAVETLAIGDDLLTADGRTVPVRWLGRQTLSNRFGLSEHRAPVLIGAGALGNGLPLRHLRVTADHALALGGLLVQAGALVNGTTIRRMTAGELGERFTVYHIETEAHDVVLAEGVPAETFIDNVTRRGFDNYAEFEALYGTPAEPLRELSQPRIMSARQVPAALKARIAVAARADLEAAA